MKKKQAKPGLIVAAAIAVLVGLALFLATVSSVYLKAQFPGDGSYDVNDGFESIGSAPNNTPDLSDHDGIETLFRGPWGDDFYSWRHDGMLTDISDQYSPPPVDRYQWVSTPAPTDGVI